MAWFYAAEWPTFAPPLTPRLDLSLEDRLNYRGTSMRLERRRGEYLDFVDGITGELLTITDTALSELIFTGLASVERNGIDDKAVAEARAYRDLSVYSKDEVGVARRKLAYVRGLIAANLLYRPQTKDVEEAIAKVAADLGDLGDAIPKPYLAKRWLQLALRRAKASHDGKTPSVADLIERHASKGRNKPWHDYETRQIIQDLIEKRYLTTERISVETLVSEVRDHIRKSIGPNAKLPGRKAVQAEIDSLPQQEVARRRYGEFVAFGKFAAVERQPDPEAPLDVIEIDHTPADVFVIDGRDGVPIGRPWIAIAIDRCTRMPLGISAGFDPPSAHSVMQCLRNAVMPKTYVQRYVDAGVWDVRGDWPAWGRPRLLRCDRARENIGTDLDVLAESLPIKVLDVKAGRRPYHKGAIERFLGTLNRTLLQEQRGTTFSSIADRGDYDPKKNAVLTFEDFLERLHIWLIDVYMRREHRELRDTPLAVWNRKVLQHKIAPIDNAADILPLFGRVEHRILRRTGIQFANLFYTSPELVALRGNRKFMRSLEYVDHKRKVRFRYDTSDLGAIHVYLPHERRHIRVPIERSRRKYATGLSWWAHKQICREAIARVGRNVDQAALDDAKARLGRSLTADTPEGMLIRGRKKMARIRQIGGVTPYGDSVRTSPADSFDDLLAAEVERELESQEEAVLLAKERATSTPIRRKSATGGKRSSPKTVKDEARHSSEPQEAYDPSDDDIDYYGEDAPAP